MKTFASSSFTSYLYGILAALALLLTASAADAATQNPLIGTWQGTSYNINGKLSHTITFNSDNTGYSTSINGSSSVSQSSTYSYSSTTITMTVVSNITTGDAVGDPVGSTQTVTYAISGSGIGSTIVFTGTNSDGQFTITLTKTSEPQNPLIGTWQSTSYYDGTWHWNGTLTFNSDNTFYFTDMNTDGSASVSGSGTYSYSSTTITTTVMLETCIGNHCCPKQPKSCG